jgi:hypothetical protein
MHVQLAAKKWDLHFSGKKQIEEKCVEIKYLFALCDPENGFCGLIECNRGSLLHLGPKKSGPLKH